MRTRVIIVLSLAVIPLIGVGLARTMGRTTEKDDDLLPVLDKGGSGEGAIVGLTDKNGNIVWWDPDYSALSPETLADIREAEAKKWNWKGTQISPASNVEQADLDLQQTICQLMAVSDEPVDRRTCFQWCLSKPGVKCVGWNGVIRSVTKAGNTTTVEVRVRPSLASRAPATFTYDSWIEIWEYDERGLRFVRGFRPEDEPDARILCFD